jgi:hypothetical protein
MRGDLSVKDKQLNPIGDHVTLTQLWTELARRLNIRFGKIQMAIHDGIPSKYAVVDIRVNTELEPESFLAR